MKTDLDIRPVYHQTDEAIKAHFNLAVLAYWIVSTTQYQLRRKGSRMSWQEVMRIAGTQIVVSTIAKRIDGNQVEVRQCTEPEKQLSDLYKKLNLISPPLNRRRKICVVHFSELKKTKQNRTYILIRQLPLTIPSLRDYSMKGKLMAISVYRGF